jgi:hypothetical protein
MRRLFNRILEIFASYLVAALAAGLAVSMTIVLVLILESLAGSERAAPHPEWMRFLDGLVTMIFLIIIVMIASAVLIFFAALLPAVAVIAVSEVRSWRSVWFYSLFGGAGGPLWYLMLEGDNPPNLLSGQRGVLFAGVAGLTGALVYWALAGRNAGAWREAPRARTT